MIKQDLIGLYTTKVALNRPKSRQTVLLINRLPDGWTYLLKSGNADNKAVYTALVAPSRPKSESVTNQTTNGGTHAQIVTLSQLKRKKNFAHGRIVDHR